MSVHTQEGRIILAIKAIRTTKNLSTQAAAKTYNVPQMTLINRIKGRIAKPEIRNARHNLTPSEEETLIQYILDLDTQGFPPPDLWCRRYSEFAPCDALHKACWQAVGIPLYITLPQAQDTSIAYL